MGLDKQKIIEAVLTDLGADLMSKRKFCKELTETINNADSAMTTRSDTYIFQYRQQIDNVSKTIEGIEKLIKLVKNSEVEFIQLGDGDIYVVVPDFGIMKQFEVGECKVFMVSKASPIGGALDGVQVGDEVEFRGRGLKVVEIL